MKFGNYEECLPTGKQYYEYRMNENVSDKKRIVCVRGGSKWYYTFDHYIWFVELTDVSDPCPKQ